MKLGSDGGLNQSDNEMHPAAALDQRLFPKWHLGTNSICFIPVLRLLLNRLL